MEDGQEDLAALDELDLDRHPDRDLLNRAADDIGQKSAARPLLERDDRDHVGNLELRATTAGG